MRNPFSVSGAVTARLANFWFNHRMASVRAQPPLPAAQSGLAKTGSFLLRIERHLANIKLSEGDRAALEALQDHVSERLPTDDDLKRWHHLLARFDRGHAKFVLRVSGDIQSEQIRAAVDASMFRVQKLDHDGVQLLLEQARSADPCGLTQWVDRHCMTFTNTSARAAFIVQLRQEADEVDVDSELATG